MEKVLNRIFNKKQYITFMKCFNKIQKQYPASKVEWVGDKKLKESLSSTEWDKIYQERAYSHWIDDISYNILFWEKPPFPYPPPFSPTSDTILQKYLHHKIKKFTVYGLEINKYLYNLISINNQFNIINISKNLSYIDSKYQKIFFQEIKMAFYKFSNRGISIRKKEDENYFETYERFIVMIEKKTENFIQLLYMFKLSEIMYEEFLIKKNVNYQKNRYGFSKYISDDYNFGYFGGRLRIKVDDENLKMMENLFKIIGSLYIHKNNLKTSLNEPIENIIHELWLNVSELVKQNHG